MNRIFVVVEFVVLVTILTLCVLWYKDPNGNLEPLVVGLSTLLGGLEFIRRVKFAVKSRAKNHKNDLREISPLELTDQQFEMVNKFIELPLVGDSYKPENQDEDLACSALSNIGFLEYSNGIYKLTDLGAKFLKVNGKNA